MSLQTTSIPWDLLSKHLEALKESLDRVMQTSKIKKHVLLSGITVFRIPQGFSKSDEEYTLTLGKPGIRLPSVGSIPRAEGDADHTQDTQQSQSAINDDDREAIFQALDRAFEALKTDLSQIQSQNLLTPGVFTVVAPNVVPLYQPLTDGGGNGGVCCRIVCKLRPDDGQQWKCRLYGANCEQTVWIEPCY